MAGWNPLGPLGGLINATGQGATVITNATVANGLVGALTGAVNGLGNYTASTSVTYTTQWYYVGPTAVEVEQVFQPEIPTPTPAAPPVNPAAARAKARELLLEFLSPVERESWERFGWFPVCGSHGGRYEIHQRCGPHNPRGAPVYRLRETPMLGALGNTLRYAYMYCIHTYEVPHEDETLGFKLLLEANEPEFLSIANATPINR